MLKEERDAIRAICKPLIGKRIYHISDPEYYIKSCLALLDALDEAEDKITFWQGEYNKAWDERNRVKEVLAFTTMRETELATRANELMADRDQWKARAEAYKDALEEGECCIACAKHPGCGQILPCERFNLDEERFGKE